MNPVRLSKNYSTREGLALMMDAAIGANNLIDVFVPLETALLIVTLAKRAEDKPEWFPHGKWATIQLIQSAIETELDSFWKDCR